MDGSIALSPREQLLSSIDELEAIIKQILENLFGERRRVKLERTSILADLYNYKQTQFSNLLKGVYEHIERENYITELEKAVDSSDNMIKQIASEIKFIDDALVEATYQAEKKLKSVHQSETNRVFSEDVIQFAHLISKSHSVSSSVYWHQGDPSRPFPNEADFLVSSLINQQPAGPSYLPGGGPTMQRISSTGSIKTMPFNPSTSQQKSFTPSPRMFMENANASTTPPMRGRPPYNARSSFLSPRSLTPALQQRRQLQHQQQQASFHLRGGVHFPQGIGAVGTMAPNAATTTTVPSPSSGSFRPMSLMPGDPRTVPMPSSIVSSSVGTLQQQQVSINLSPNMNKTGSLQQQQQINVVQMVGQMSSGESSSSSSSDDEQS